MLSRRNISAYSAVSSTIHRNKANLPKLTALEVTAVNITTTTGTLTIGAVIVPFSRPLLAQYLRIMTQ
jgi:hypothetical protein